MKIDKVAASRGLSRDEDYFASCWFNMVHEYSVDSYRVKVVNPKNALRELLRIHEMGGQEERAMVREEAARTLQADPVMQEPPFSLSCGKLCKILQGKAIEKEKDGGQQTSMMRYLISELHHNIASSYIQRSLTLLEEILVNGTLRDSAE